MKRGYRGRKNRQRKRKYKKAPQFEPGAQLEAMNSKVELPIYGGGSLGGYSGGGLLDFVITSNTVYCKLNEQWYRRTPKSWSLRDNGWFDYDPLEYEQ